MNAEVKERWVTALRSGEFKQGRVYLRASNDQTGAEEFCCLGVLCLIEDPESWSEEPRHEGGWLHRGEEELPDEDLMEEMGLSRSEVSYLAEMNDAGDSFEEIADYIEREL